MAFSLVAGSAQGTTGTAIRFRVGTTRLVFSREADTVRAKKMR
jgi:hypothetical protein